MIGQDVVTASAGLEIVGQWLPGVVDLGAETSSLVRSEKNVLEELREVGIDALHG
jgi:hypothetical protein